MAFAIASGLPPQAGIYCAIVAGFLVSALGGSMTAIGGPAGAFVVVVAGIVNQYGINGLFLCTMMAGIMPVALGATGVGSAVKYIPRPVIVGFTNGIAVLIASTQLRDFFGLQIGEIPDDFIGRMRAVFSNFQTLSWPVAAQADKGGHPGVDRHVCVDCDRRSHRCSRSRYGAGGAALHQTGGEYDVGGACHRKIDRRGPCALAAGSDDSRVRRRIPHPRSVPFWRDG